MYKKNHKHNDIISPLKQKSKRDDFFSIETEKDHNENFTERVNLDRKHHLHKFKDEKVVNVKCKRIRDINLRENSHSPVHQVRNRSADETMKILETPANDNENNFVKKYHYQRPQSARKSPSKKPEFVHKANTFNMETRYSNKISEYDKRLHHRPRSAKRSAEENKQKISQIWYCQVETNSPFKPHKKNLEILQKDEKSKHLKKSGGRYSPKKQELMRKISPDKDTKLSPINKSKTERRKTKSDDKSHKRDENFNKGINAKIEKEKQQIQIEVDKKIEDGMKIYFTKLQNLIDKRLEAFFHTKENSENRNQTKKHDHRSKHGKAKENVHMETFCKNNRKDKMQSKKDTFYNIPITKKNRTKEFVEDNRRHHKHRKHHSFPTPSPCRKSNQSLLSVEFSPPTHKRKPQNYEFHSRRTCHGKTQVDFTGNMSKTIKITSAEDQKLDKACGTSGIIAQKEGKHMKKEVSKENIIRTPSTSMMYMKPLIPRDNSLNFIYNENSSKYLSIYDVDSNLDKYRCKDKENQFWVEGVEPAKKDTHPKSGRKKIAPNLECKTVSIIGIQPQVKGNYCCYNSYLEDLTPTAVPDVEQILGKRNRLKRFKLYYQYSLHNKPSASSDSDTGQIRVPSESLKILSDFSDLSYKEDKEIINVLKAPSKSYIDRSIEESRNRLDSQKPDKKPQKQLVPNKRKIKNAPVSEVYLTSKSDVDVSYNCLNNTTKRHIKTKIKHNPNRQDIAVKEDKKEPSLEDRTIKSFYKNIDLFKQIFDKETLEHGSTSLQVLQFLENMHHLYLVSQQIIFQNHTSGHQCLPKQECFKTVEGGPFTATENVTSNIQTIVEQLFSGEEKEIDQSISVNLHVDKSVQEPNIIKKQVSKELFVNKSIGFCATSENSRAMPEREKKDQMTSYEELVKSVQVECNRKDEEPPKEKKLKHEPKKFTDTSVAQMVNVDTTTSIIDEIKPNNLSDKIQKRQLKNIDYKKSKLDTGPPTKPSKDSPPSKTTDKQKPEETVELSKPLTAPISFKTKSKKAKSQRSLATTNKPAPQQLLTLPTILEKSLSKTARRPQSAKFNNELQNYAQNFKIKKSQSEINFEEASKITADPESLQSIELTDRFNEKDQSLDSYLPSNKSILTEHPYNSRLLITKSYRLSDVSSYQKRKKYDEVIRKKMKKRLSLQEKQSGQVFEVRYLNLDGIPAKMPEPEKLHNSIKEAKLKSTHKKYKKKMYFLNHDIKAPYSNLFEFLSQLPDAHFQDSHRHIFNSRNKCEECEGGKHFMHFVNYLRNSLKSKCNSGKSTEDESVQSDGLDEKRNENRKSVSRKKKVVNMHNSIDDTASSCNGEDTSSSRPKKMSCPALRVRDSSFDFLYQDDTSTNDEGKTLISKEPINSILGFSLNSETTKKDQISPNSPCSETSGYASSKSRDSFPFTSFFKKPKVAALLKPQVEGMFTKDTSVYDTMCQDDILKLKRENEDDFYEEIPLDILLKTCTSSTLGKSISDLNLKFCESEPIKTIQEEEVVVKRFKSDTNLISGDIHPQPSATAYGSCQKTPKPFQSQNSKNPQPESQLSIDQLIYKHSNQNISVLEKIVNSYSCQTDLNSFNINLVESDEGLKLSQSRGSRTNVSDGQSYSEIKVVVAKKFFEHIFEMYESELVLSSALLDDEFLKNELLSSVKRWKKAEKNKISFTSKLRAVAKRVFHCHQNSNSEKKLIPEATEAVETVNNEYQQILQELAQTAHNYFSMFVQAVDIEDEMKVYGILRLLEEMEKGHFNFLKKFAESEKEGDLEKEIKEQVKQTFIDVYSCAKRRASKCGRKLSSNELKLMLAFVCKYRIGLLSKTEIIASYLGKGFFENETQLKAAVTFLLKTSNDVNFQEFEESCRNHLINFC